MPEARKSGPEPASSARGERPSRTWLLIACAILAGLLSWWLSPAAAPVPALEPPPKLEGSAPREAAWLPKVPKPPAAPGRLPAPEQTAPPAPKAEAPRLNAPFCTATGDDKITIRYTLGRALHQEWARRVNLTKGGPLEPSAENGLLLALVSGRKPAADLYPLATEASARGPERAWLLAMVAQTAEAAGEPDAQLGALRKLRALLPKEPGIDWALLSALRDSPDQTEAIEALDRYLHADPVPGLQRLRARLAVQRDLQQEYRKTTRDGITVTWAPEALREPQAEALAAEVAQALESAAALSGTQRRRRLSVVVYPSRSELLAVSCVQSWAGALYDGTLRLVAWNDPLLGVRPQALRHEALHAQVSPQAPRAPLWFHEGLAQSFASEAPEALSYWRLMVKNRSWIPFSSLTESFQVFDSSDDARLAYAQSLALVELLREQAGQGAVAEALRAFQEGETTQGALARALHRSELRGDELLDFIESRLARNR